MQTKLLLPNRYKRPGWFIFMPCLIMVCMPFFLPEDSTWNIFYSHNIFSKWTLFEFPNSGDFFTPWKFKEVNFSDEIFLSLTAIGFFFVAFSRERIDDERIMSIRLESLLYAFYGHIAGFLIILWSTYDFSFMFVLSWNMLTAPVIFLIRFHWVVYVRPYWEDRREAI